jgi:hypothetical protein
VSAAASVATIAAAIARVLSLRTQSPGIGLVSERSVKRLTAGSGLDAQRARQVVDRHRRQAVARELGQQLAKETI